MKKIPLFISCLFAMAAVAGAGSTEVSDRKINVNEKLPRPGHILVYDFASTSADVPANSALAGKYSEHPTPQTEEQLAAGRQAAAEIAAELVAQLSDLGLPAQRPTTATKLQRNDIVIRGYLLSLDEGDATKRVAIGFGSGSSKLAVAVEGFQMTAKGLRKLGSGTVEAGGSKGPGAAAPLAVAVAKGNPLGLIVNVGMKAHGEKSGNAKIEGRARDIAKEITKELKPRLKQQGWIK